MIVQIAKVYLNLAKSLKKHVWKANEKNGQNRKLMYKI